MKPVMDYLSCLHKKSICYDICAQAADDVVFTHGEAFADTFYDICIGHCPLCGSEGGEAQDGDEEGGGT